MTADQIAARIRDEHRKYHNSNIDWVLVAAKKIMAAIEFSYQQPVELSTPAQGEEAQADKMTLKQFDEYLDRLDMAPILNARVRQVKWLYNNSNKLTKVYEEKLVRLMVHRLQAENERLREQVVMYKKWYEDAMATVSMYRESLTK
jgi:hypothetical protein